MSAPTPAPTSTTSATLPTTPTPTTAPSPAAASTPAIDAAAGPGGDRPPALFRHAVAAEWAKITARRATWVTLGAGTVLAAGLTALVALGVGATWDDWSPADRADFEPILFPLVGGFVTGVLLIMLGVRAMTNEYSSGMIRLTLTATPRRDRVLAAKVVVVTALTLAAGLVATVALFVTGQAVFGAFDLPTASLGDGRALRVVAVSSLLTPLFPVIGVALGVLMRSTAGAVTSVLAMLFVPSVLGPLLPRWWRVHVLAVLPDRASDALALGSLDTTDGRLRPAVAALVLAAWLVVLLGAARIALARRDA